jgi:hypothetical protein
VRPQVHQRQQRRRRQLRRRSKACSYQHTSAYVSIRQHTAASTSLGGLQLPAYVSIRQHASAYVSIRQHTSGYVSIRQHTSPAQTPSTPSDRTTLQAHTHTRCSCVSMCTSVPVKQVNRAPSTPSDRTTLQACCVSICTSVPVKQVN